MIYNFLRTLILFGAFQGLLIFIVLALKPNKVIGSRLLMTLLIISSAYLLFQYFVLDKLFLDYPHLIGVFLPLLFVIPPLFFFFIAAEKYPLIGRSNAKFLWYHFFIPFAVLCLMVPYYTLEESIKLEFLYAHTNGFDLYPYGNYFGIALLMSFLIYGVASLLIFRHDLFKKKNSYLINYAWVFNIITLTIGGLQVIDITIGVNAYATIVLTVLAFSFLIHMLAFTAIKTSRVSSGKSIPINHGTLSEKNRKVLKERIIFLFENNNVHRDSQLSSDYFCEELKMNKKYFSQLINQEFAQNFTSLVNHYRVKESKHLLLSEEYDYLNLYGIADKVGFGSKDAFIRAFKKELGITPYQFRRK